MQKNGATFANYFVTDSLCWPVALIDLYRMLPAQHWHFQEQRSGRRLHIRNRGLDQTTLATALSRRGFRTAMMGKYLNGYNPGRHPAAPGWSAWEVAGDGYAEFKYALSQDGETFATAQALRLFD